MAELSITIPDAIAARVRNAFAKAYGYQATIPDPDNPGSTIPNPENKTQFMRRKVKEYIKNVVLGVEPEAEAQAARIAKVAEVEAAINFPDGGVV